MEELRAKFGSEISIRQKAKQDELDSSLAQ